MGDRLSSFVTILGEISDQLEDAIQDQTDFTVHFEPFWFPIAETPAVDMYIGNPTGYEEGKTGFGGHTMFGAFPVTIRARVGMADGQAGQELLFGMMDDEGPLSIMSALIADETFGGVAQSFTWGDTFPWLGVQAYADINGDGFLAGSEMTIVVTRLQS